MASLGRIPIVEHTVHRIAFHTLAAASTFSLFALGVQLSFLPKLSQIISSNQLPMVDRTRLVAVAMGYSALCMAGVATVSRRVELRSNSVSVTHVLRDTASFFRPLALLAWLPTLLKWDVQSVELVAALVFVAYGWALLTTCHVALVAVPTSSWTPRRVPPIVSRHLPLTLLCTLTVGFATYFTHFSHLHHLRLQTHSFDLAIFDNLFWNLLHNKPFKASPVLGPEGSHLQFHATFLAYVFLPLYRLRPGAETLLVIQSCVSAAALPAAYLYSRGRGCSPWLALGFAAAFALLPAAHGPLFYDFHFLTLAAPFVIFCLWALECGSLAAFCLAWLFAVLLREDVSAGLFCAALFYLTRREHLARATALACASLLYFGAVKFVVMPLFSPSNSATFTHYYNGFLPEGQSGFAAMVLTLFTNPLFAVKTIFTREKCLYLVLLFGPFLGLSLKRCSALLLFMFPALATLLAPHYPPLSQISFQYTYLWIPYIFLAAVVTVTESRLSLPYRTAAVASLCVTSLLFGFTWGAYSRDEPFRGGFRTVGFSITDGERERHKQLHTLIGLIPVTASVAATETEAAHVSTREDIFTFRFGHQDADYLLVNADEARHLPSKKVMHDALRSGKYGLLERQGDFLLWKRGASTAKNPEGLAALRLREVR